MLYEGATSYLIEPNEENNEITISHLESRIRILPFSSITIHPNILPLILLDSKKTARDQRKKSRSKSQIQSDSVKLDASRMKKNDPTLTTSNTLKIRLF